MPNMFFVNVPTRDLARSDAFYSALGFNKNETFSDEQASCWVVSEHIYIMVLVEDFFASFLRDGDEPNLRSKTIGSLNALSVESDSELEQMLERAVVGGGSVYRPAFSPFEGMTEAAMKDPDGHVWELSFMDIGSA
ncbi:MAG: lactoylglutathione lyase [Leucobacter sp.]|nr:lactoylglutathione lyase [Leucobacter sp.]